MLFLPRLLSPEARLQFYDTLEDFSGTPSLRRIPPREAIEIPDFDVGEVTLDFLLKVLHY